MKILVDITNSQEKDLIKQLELTKMLAINQFRLSGMIEQICSAAGLLIRKEDMEKATVQWKEIIMQVNLLKDSIELIPEGDLEEIYLEHFGLEKAGDELVFKRADAQGDDFILVTFYVPKIKN